MSRRSFLTRASGLALAGMGGNALGQADSRTIKLIVPFPPGGHADFTARLISGPLGEALGETVVVENKTGAGGLIGAQAALQPPFDGRTLIMHVSSSAVLVAITRDPMPFDPLTAFEPIAMIGSQPLALAVGPSVKAQTVREFVDDAKRRPGKLSRGSSGLGSAAHIGGEYFNMQAGNIEIAHVPYRGGGPVMNDLAGGTVDCAVEALSVMLPFHRQGRIRLLAVLAEKRSELAPEVPTAREAGIDAVVPAYALLAAPSGMPRERFAKIAAATQEVMKRPDVLDGLKRASIEPHPGFGPDQTRRFIAEEVETLTRVVKRAKISVN